MTFFFFNDKVPLVYGFTNKPNNLLSKIILQSDPR